MTETEAFIVCNAIPGIGNATIRRIWEHFGSLQKIFSIPESVLIKENILLAKVVQKIYEFKRDNFLKNEYNLISKQQIQVVTYPDKHYPNRLKEIPDAPMVLYCKGRVPADNDLAFSIVGSRRASFYGLSMAEKFAGRLAELGITVVSGMARGVDTSAHRGCLKARGITTAVLGCGLTHIYPPENKRLFEDIAQQGSVISEFPMSMPPMAKNFPRRNRIISGLSLGVLVVEASARSGALITSNFALEQGREVFAIPGKVDNPTAQGTNRLIKQGAKLVGCIEDILEELGPQIKLLLADGSSEAAAEQKSAVGPVSDDISNLTEKERAVFNCINKVPVYIDELAAKCESSVVNIMNVLLSLELKHCIKQLPGKLFVRV